MKQHIYFVKTIEIDNREFDIMKFADKLFIRAKTTDIKYKNIKSVKMLRTRAHYTKDFENFTEDLFFRFHLEVLHDRSTAKKILQYYLDNEKEFDKAQYVVDRKYNQQMNIKTKVKHGHH